MAECIKDGTGHGYLAKVTEDGKLTTYATVSPYIAYACDEHQDAYNINLIRAPVSGGVETIVMQIKNDSANSKLHIWNELISYNGGNTNHNRVMEFNLRLLGVSPPTSGFIITYAAPMWINLPKLAPVIAYLWDKTTPGGMTMSSVGTLVFSTLVSQGSFMHALDGALIVPPGETITYSMNAEETGLANLAVKMYYISEE